LGWYLLERESVVEKVLGLEIIEVVEQAALASARLMGKGLKNEADAVAVEAMRNTMNKVRMRGRIVIGEGERDEAPMLYIGEEVGICTQPDAADFCRLDELLEIDIAVDPCEGTNLVASGSNNSMAVLAISEKGGLFHAPDFYMRKLAAPPQAKGKVHIDYPAEKNLKIIAECLDRNIEDLLVIVMDRPRHKDLIAEIRATGARVKLISDGDISAALSAVINGTGVHALMGIGAAPEGVISAAAIRCLGGHFQGRLIYDPAEVNTPESEKWTRAGNAARLKEMGVEDPDKVFEAEDLASGENVLFAATGITDGDFIKGVRFFGGGARTETMVISSQSSTIRFVDTVHILDKKQFASFEV
jgi:fructose-1,6-bisphosphatase II / sedoheptulose-1,7-bisphosphatase